MTKITAVKNWKEAAKIVTGLNDDEFDKLYTEMQEMKKRHQNRPKKIQLCCPDMNLAIEKDFITVVNNHPYITHLDSPWDLDFCPFCGKEVVLIRCSNQTMKEVS